MIGRQESIIVETISRFLIPFVQLFGLYVIMHGHSSPGGGFQGGVLLGASFLLLGMVFGLDRVKQRFPVKVMMFFVSLGVFIYVGIGLLCLLLGANFLNYGILPVPLPRYMGMFGIELGVGITVMAVMVSLYYDLIRFE